MFKKILIVDDADFMHEMLEEMLDSTEYEIVGYSFNGRDAVERYKKLMKKGNKPDIVTMDILMPEKDGIKAIKEIKKFDPLAKILVISALNDPDPIGECMEAGAVKYLLKPFTKKKLLTTLEKVLTED